MDLIALKSLGKWGLRYSLATRPKHWRKRKMIKTCYMRFLYLPRNSRDMCFLFFILDAKIPKFTHAKFEKSWHQVKERWTSTCIKQVILKPSNTVVLCYLALNAFFVGSFGEINLTSVKIIILNDFLWSWTGFNLDIETYYNLQK